LQNNRGYEFNGVMVMLRYYCNRYEQANKQQSIGGGGNHATTLFSGCETTSLRNVDSEIAILLNYTTIQPILREIGLLSKRYMGNDHVFKNKDSVIEGRLYPLHFNSKLVPAETQKSTSYCFLHLLSCVIK
jgi:hypothetical protein